MVNQVCRRHLKKTLGRFSFAVWLWLAAGWFEARRALPGAAAAVLLGAWTSC
jgi:hypothetical protein